MPEFNNDEEALDYLEVRGWVEIKNGYIQAPYFDNLEIPKDEMSAWSYLVDEYDFDPEFHGIL